MRRWNGFVDSAVPFGEVTDEGVGAAGSLAWFIFLKNGFFVSAPKEDEGFAPELVGLTADSVLEREVDL